MLRLTKKTDYGTIALVYLCTHRERVVSAREISARFGVPLPILSNILKALSRRGLVRSVRGTNGGYQLAQSPERIRLTQIIEALEGPFRLADCMCRETHADPCGCQITTSCPISRPLLQIHRQVEDLLNGVTIASLAAAVPAATE
jgi:Rrf2 family protein